MGLAICKRIVERAGGTNLGGIRAWPGCDVFLYNPMRRKPRPIVLRGRAVSVVLVEENTADVHLARKAFEEYEIEGEIIDLTDGDGNSVYPSD